MILQTFAPRNLICQGLFLQFSLALWLPMALPTVCCICLCHHLPSVFCISHILFTYRMRENKSLILPSLCGTNIWTLRIKSKIPVGTELKSNVSPDFIMPSFLLNIDVFFILLIETCDFCIINITVGNYAMLGSMSCPACKETDRPCVKWSCFQMWYRCITHTIM